MSIAEARDRLERGELAEAVEILEALIDADDRDVQAYAMLGKVYEAAQQHRAALAAWEGAYRLEPSSANIHAAIERLTGVRPAPLPPPPAPLDEPFPSEPTEVPDAGPPAVSASPPVPEPAASIPGPWPTSGQVLRAEGLTKRYRKRTVVNGVDLEVRQGEVVGLLGPNGAGKTTTFYMIVGMVRPNKGRIRLDDADLTRLPMYKRARLGIGYLAQEASIFTHMTVEDNLYAVLEYQKLRRRERRVRVEELIEEFRLEHVRKSKGYMLSGGERRRTEIARALAARPSFFLLDEPFAGVDPIAVEDIQSIVAGLKERGIGVLITDHNVHETLAITDRAYLLYEGEILKQGTAEVLADDAEVRRRYLGENFTLERYK